MRAALASVVVLAACGADHYGAYVEIHSDVGFDHLELFFGGAFQQRKSCGSASLANPPPVAATATWTAQTSPTAAAQDPARVTMWRRQYHADTDSKDFPAGTRSYAIRLPTLEDDADFTDTLGSELFVVATGTDAMGRPTREYAQVQNIVAPSNLVNQYIVTLSAVETGREIELWGTPGAPACLRTTVSSTTGGPDTSFIVREWDHDCDGLLTQLCPEPSAQVIDCDPERYCVPSATDGCAVANGCATPATAEATAELVCQFGTCSNAGGQRTCRQTGSTGLTCISQDMCQVNLAQCDRRFDQCAFVDANPDYRCAIPVMTTGTDHFLCDTQTPVTVALGALTGGDCPTSVSPVGPVLRGSNLPEVTFGIAATANSCDLVITPLAVRGFHPVGFLPTTRLLLELGSSASTMLVDVGGSLACGDPATCEPQGMGSGSGSGSGSDPFAGTPHTCQ